MPNLCPKGHDKDEVGVTKWRRCRQCERERLRTARQERRKRTKAPFRYPNPPKRVKPVTDGLEALYGPVPDLVPDADWFDEVIVDRVLSHQRPGRRPYPLEWAEIFRRMPALDITDAGVAEVCGISLDRLGRLRGELNERRSFVLATGGHLTDVGKMGKDFS